MHDVIVIGAGPAGNIAALKLSNMGYRVATLDWRQNIGDKLCTGIIGLECVDRFPPDESLIYNEARAATIVSPEGKRYRIVRDDTQAFVIDRVAYVNSMAERAIEAGADYEIGPRVSNIEVSESGVVVSTTGDGGQNRWQAEMVVIASGFGSPLLGMVGLRNERQSDYMIGYQAKVEVNELEDTEVYLGEKIAPGSFGWLVPKSNSSALVGIVSQQKLNGQMESFLDTLKENGRVRSVIEKPRQWGIPLKPPPKTYGDRVLVVGDAAGQVKPTTGGGIYYAQLSGEMAAAAANEAIIAGDFGARKLKSYEKEWKVVIGKELRIGYYARMMYASLGDQHVERLLSEFMSEGVEDELINNREFSFDWHSGLILNAIRHKRLGRVIRSFGPAVAPFLTRLVRSKFS